MALNDFCFITEKKIAHRHARSTRPLIITWSTGLFIGEATGESSNASVHAGSGTPTPMTQTSGQTTETATLFTDVAAVAAAHFPHNGMQQKKRSW